VAAAAGGGGEEDPLTIDNDGDGLSENAGDCNDGNPNVKPSGTVSFAVDFAFSGSVNCGARNSRAQTYRVTNNSCATVTATQLSVAARRVSGNCSYGAQTTQLPIQTSAIGSGAVTTIRTGAAAGAAGLGLCCFGESCQTGSCVTEFDYTLNTSAGTFTAANSYTITFPNPNSCPPGSQCPRNQQVPPYAFGFSIPVPMCAAREFE
jgi:hypothetical protein